MRVLGKRPQDEAESMFFDKLTNSNLTGQALFGLELIGSNEIDCLLWLDNIGWFVIEIKGFRTNDFKSVCRQNITFNKPNHQNKYGYKPTPWKQSEIARKKLSSSIYDRYYTRARKTEFELKNGEKLPFIFSLVYFPFISESEFKTKFPNTFEEIKFETIFNDFNLNPKMLIEICKSNIEIQNRNNKYHIKYDEKLADFYNNKIFNFEEENANEEKYDYKLINLLEKQDYINEIKNINFDYPVLRTGYAGTGKTILGLKILQKFAAEDKTVMFTCYNKVLASDIRRLIKLSLVENYKFLENIVVKDIFELIDEYSDNQYQKDLSIKDSTKRGFDEIAESAVERIRKSGFFENIYDYIVVDEAQDIKDYAWYLLYYLSKKGANSMTILNGKEQNLYLQKPSIKLLEFENYLKQIELNLNLKGNVLHKRRIYRNKTNAFLFAQSFLLNFPDFDLSNQFILKNQSKSDSTFLFERDLGGFPKIIHTHKKNKFEDRLKNVIKGCNNEIKNYGLGQSGLVIAVPYSKNNQKKETQFYINSAIKVLNDLNIQFIDYSTDSNRRLLYNSTQTRIIPYHSLRGIESDLTIILGFEELLNLAEITNCDFRNLGYIALSRAKYETYLFFNSIDIDNHDFPFLEYCNQIFNKCTNGDKLFFGDKPMLSLDNS